MSDITVSDGGSPTEGISFGDILGGGIITLGDAAVITRGGIHIGL